LTALSLHINYLYLGIVDEFPWFQSYPVVYWSDDASVGVSLRISIFNGGVVRAKTRQAQIQIDKLEAYKRDTRLALDLDLRNAITQLNNSLISLNTQNENVNLAKEIGRAHV